MKSAHSIHSNPLFGSFFKTGWVFFILPVAAFGVQHLIYAISGGKAGIGPPWTPVQPFWAYVFGALMIAFGVCIATGKYARVAAILLGVLLVGRVLVVYLPGLVANVRDPGNWTGGFELLALCGASLTLAATLRNDRSPIRLPEGVLSNLSRLGRYLYALALIVFGVQHFQYAAFIATLIPNWIPAHLFWAYFVGVAFFGASLSIVSRIQTRLATGLLALMFLLWVLVLHIPRAVTAVNNSNEWTSTFMALAMAGGALILYGSGPTNTNSE
jgi:uncharacterized membrane protein YphA (DoxX/SURF4 family)